MFVPKMSSTLHFVIISSQVPTRYSSLPDLKRKVDYIVCGASIAAISTLTYFLTGFALAFSEGNGFFGYGHFALLDMPDEMMALCFFQYSFAAVAATIPSGVVHERSSAIAFLLYTALTSGWNSVHHFYRYIDKL